ELQFILAEAAVKGWVFAEPAQTYYERGITSAITMWGLNVPTNPDYMNTALTRWYETDTEWDKMERIHIQKYYALYFTDLQSWFEYRRTGHPQLPIGPGHLNEGRMPRRLNYPVYVSSTNKENY